MEKIRTFAGLKNKEMSAEKFAVIGIGNFGRAIALSLSRKGAEVMVIDTNYERIDQISDEVSYAVTLDATDKRALLSQDILIFDVVIIAIGSNFEQRLLCAAVLMDLGIKRIVCRALGHNQRMILEKMGITEILSPEDEAGKTLARRLLNPNMISYYNIFCVIDSISFIIYQRVRIAVSNLHIVRKQTVISDCDIPAFKNCNRCIMTRVKMLPDLKSIIVIINEQMIASYLTILIDINPIIVSVKLYASIN